ncbi:MAG: LacI family transcriptional regulator [Defluviitaleaceae bacterium]|nr:LacI family transcriptional regulator [Defluviitaleaceae bacterium]
MNSSQIAKLAGVSRSTVSRVINGYDNVPKSTHDKVMQVIRENNYHPHLSGQLLVGKKTGTLGFFWIKGENASIAHSELSSAYMVHVVEAAARMGYLILTCILENLTDPENVDWVNKIFMQGRIDAGIFIGVDNEEPLIEDLIAGDNVVGLFDHYHPDRTEPNRISANFEEDTGGKIIDYLHSLGHKKIALIHGDENRYSSAKRKESFLAAMQKHGMEIRPEWMCLGGIDEHQGYQAAKEMLIASMAAGELPTAICANNDAVAFGVYRALEELNISVPDQISVTGIDGHIRMIDPSLTTYAFDYYEFFSSLIMRTIAAVEEREDNPTTEFIKGRLVERGSTVQPSSKTH